MVAGLYRRLGRTEENRKALEEFRARGYPGELIDAAGETFDLVEDFALPLPARCPTMACFGDADLRTLYVTTARAKRTADELARTPLAGCSTARTRARIICPMVTSPSRSAPSRVAGTREAAR